MTGTAMNDAAPALRVDERSAASMLADPATSAAWLAEIAQHHPMLWARVAEHPSAYPHLVAWMRGHCAGIREGLLDAQLPYWERVEQGIAAAARRHPQLLDPVVSEPGAERATRTPGADCATRERTHRSRKAAAAFAIAAAAAAAAVVITGIAVALTTG